MAIQALLGGDDMRAGRQDKTRQDRTGVVPRRDRRLPTPRPTALSCSLCYARGLTRTTTTAASLTALSGRRGLPAVCGRRILNAETRLGETTPSTTLGPQQRMRRQQLAAAGQTCRRLFAGSGVQRGALPGLSPSDPERIPCSDFHRRRSVCNNKSARNPCPCLA